MHTNTQSEVVISASSQKSPVYTLHPYRKFLMSLAHGYSCANSIEWACRLGRSGLGLVRGCDCVGSVKISVTVMSALAAAHSLTLTLLHTSKKIELPRRPAGCCYIRQSKRHPDVPLKYLEHNNDFFLNLNQPEVQKVQNFSCSTQNSDICGTIIKLIKSETQQC